MLRSTAYHEQNEEEERDESSQKTKDVIANREMIDCKRI